VAKESTGVYWIPLFELLESRGLTVLLVNARHVKNVSGRKSDVLDCQWLQQLMTYGLLSGAFRPTEQVCVLRALWLQHGRQEPARQLARRASVCAQASLQFMSRDMPVCHSTVEIDYLYFGCTG
jgi:transposase